MAWIKLVLPCAWNHLAVIHTVIHVNRQPDVLQMEAKRSQLNWVLHLHLTSATCLKNQVQCLLELCACVMDTSQLFYQSLVPRGQLRRVSGWPQACASQICLC